MKETSQPEKELRKHIEKEERDLGYLYLDIDREEAQAAEFIAAQPQCSISQSGII